MTAGATRMTFKLAAVIFLVAAGIGWWKLFGRGFTMGGVFLPAFNTGMGLFLWFFAGIVGRALDGRQKKS